MSKHLGMGVMLNILGGNKETVESINQSLGKEIEKVELIDDALIFSFKDKTIMKVWDDGQSCCETRYMTTDDDLRYYCGSIFTDIEIADAPSIADEWGEHEVQFLKVTTSKGVFTMETHNEHNGYYAGFSISAKIITENL